jgi:NAD(P)-dependent dehydrogenase (short-subunit alcohol dehydrogenase family)
MKLLYERRINSISSQVMNAPFKLTVDGFESQWQINYLAPFVLTSSLLPLLLTTASESKSLDQVRVINVASDAALLGGPRCMPMHLEDVNMTNAKGMTETM